jgi:hypothetical protein
VANVAEDRLGYGFAEARIERVKAKMKQPAVRERLKTLVSGLTRYDLQNRVKVRTLVQAASRILNEPLTPAEEDLLVEYVLAQRIDPRNKLHLIRLWAMFR